MAEAPAPAEPTAAQAAETMRSRPFVGLLVVSAVIGVIVSLAAWGYLELVFQIQQELFKHLPHALGYEQGPPLWWSLPVLAVGALIVALAITRLPGDGGHVPAKGLGAGGLVDPVNLPGVVLAGVAGLGFGVVLGPEGPLLAIGSGLAVLAIRLSRREMESPVLAVIAGAGSFAALSFVFASPLIAAVILIEATAIGGARLPLVLLPGLLAAGVGTLVSVGMGSFTGLEQPRLRAGPAAAAPLRPSRHRPVRLDDRAGDRGGRGRQTDHAGRAGHVPRGRAANRDPVTDRRPDHRRARDRVPRRHGQECQRGPVLRAGGASRAAQAGRDVVARHARAGDRVQGPCLHAVARRASAAARCSRRCSSPPQAGSWPRACPDSV